MRSHSFDELYGVNADTLESITQESLIGHLGKTVSVFDAIEKELAKLEPPLHVEKMGLARAVIDTVKARAVKLKDGEPDELLQRFENNMRALFTQLTSRQRAAERELTTDRVSQKIDRLKRAFLDDHRHGVTREVAGLLFESFEAVLDETDESEAIRHVIRQLRKEHNLQIDVTKPVDDIEAFRNDLQSLYYTGRLQTQVPDDLDGGGLASFDSVASCTPISLAEPKQKLKPSTPDNAAT